MSTATRAGRRPVCSTAASGPPGPGLHPVRDHLAHLPQPSPPQELVGILVCALAHLHRVVVAPHCLAPHLLSRSDRPLSVPRWRMGVEVTLHPGGDRTCVRTPSRYTSPPTTRQEPISHECGNPGTLPRHEPEYVAARARRARRHQPVPRRARAPRRDRPDRRTPRLRAHRPAGRRRARLRGRRDRQQPAVRRWRRQGDEPLLLLTSGAHRVDTAKVAADARRSGPEARQARVRTTPHRSGHRRGLPLRPPRAGAHLPGPLAAAGTTRSGPPRATPPRCSAAPTRSCSG